MVTTKRMWHPEVHVDEAIAARCVAKAHPDLAPTTVVELGRGWDNVAFLMDDAWVWRFPHRALGATLLEREIRWAPNLARHLPVVTSAPQRVGKPSDGYPFPFAGYPMVVGRTACDLTLTEAQRAAVAEPLAAVLRALHAVPVPVGSPVDVMGKLDVTVLKERFEAPLVRLTPSHPDLVAGARRLMSSFDGQVAPTTSAMVHGDLYARHVVIDEGLAGLIDWGDLHAGQVATDLSVAWLMFDADVRAGFWQTYGAHRGDQAWARLRATVSAVACLDYGVEVGDQAMAQAGHRGLVRCLG